MVEPIKGQTAPVAPQAPKHPQYILDAARKMGKNPEEVVKLFNTFTTQHDRGVKVGKAVTATIGELKKRHLPEYKEILRGEYTKQGLDPSTIKD